MLCGYLSFFVPQFQIEDEQAKAQGKALTVPVSSNVWHSFFGYAYRRLIRSVFILSQQDREMHGISLSWILRIQELEVAMWPP